MTEQELYDVLTDEVAKTLTDSEYRMGTWARINRVDASAQERDAVLYFLRMAGAALTVLAPMIAERDSQIDQLQLRLRSGPDASPDSTRSSS